MERNLLILNYEMSRKSQVFSHQIEIATLLSRSFSSTTVVSGKAEAGLSMSGIDVRSTRWIEGKNVRNSLKFLLETLPIIVKTKNLVVFSHMTNMQSLLILPFTKIFRVKHFLWYAHASNPWSLRILSRFLDGILTSTVGSCPIANGRIFYLGQSVDPSKFHFKIFATNSISKFVHVGRFDPSKKIEEILNFISEYRIQYPNASIEIIGSPSSQSLSSYQEEVFARYESGNPWIKFTPAVARETLPVRLLEHDCFVHAFQGSLDKTLIEATLSGLPVLTLNREYERIFGPWGALGNTLSQQIAFINGLDITELQFELARRRKIASEGHSLDSWVSKVASILKN